MDKASLKKILTSINKKREAENPLVNFYWDIKHTEIERISTWLPSLDYCLWWGQPMGRIIEIYWDEASWKCLPISTRLLTSKGYKTIWDIFIDNNIVPSCTNKIIKNTWDLKLINRYWKSEWVLSFTCNNRKRVNKIKTSNWLEIESTLNHPHLVLNERWNHVWKKTRDIVEWDYLCRYRGDMKKVLPYVDYEAYDLWILIADWYFWSNRISITNDDKCIQERIMQFKDTLNLREPIINNTDFQINSKELVNKFYEKYWLKKWIAKDKTIPEYIYTSSQFVKASFLRWYFDCEGYFSSKWLEVVSASKNLIQWVQLILWELGIKWNITNKIVKNYDHNNYYTLLVTGNNYYKVLTRIWLGTDARKEQVHNSIKDTTQDSTQDSIPYMWETLQDILSTIEATRNDYEILSVSNIITKWNKLTYNVLDNFLKHHKDKDHYLFTKLREIRDCNYIYEKVTTNEYSDKVPTFDIEMEKTSSFIANWLVTHNTSWAIQLLVEVQKAYPKSFQAIIDVEHAFDWEYATALWLDMEKIIFAQPDTAEEAIDLMITLSGTESVRAVIFDSVAQMPTAKEVEWNAWDAEMWMRARLLSQAMRKLAPVAEKNKCLVLLINQTRTNIGQMWWNPETTPGGSAIKFAASVRIRTATKKDKKNDSIWVTTFKIIKNKVGVPFRTTEIEIAFWKWFNATKDLLTLAMTLWVIYQAWASYSFRDKKWQGKEKMFEEFMEDEKLRQDIKDVIPLFDSCKDTVDQAIAVGIITDNKYDKKSWEKEGLMRKEFLEDKKLLKDLTTVLENSL